MRNCVFVRLASPVRVCVEGWLILSELGRKQGGCKINGQDKDYCSWKRQKSHYIEFFFCKRRKPKNVFRATEILSTPCVCSPYFTIRNSGTRGVEGIRWWGASLLGIINSGAGGQPGYWRAQVGPYGYLTPAPSTITLLLLLLLLFLFLHFYWLTMSLLRGQNRGLSFLNRL